MCERTPISIVFISLFRCLKVATPTLACYALVSTVPKGITKKIHVFNCEKIKCSLNDLIVNKVALDGTKERKLCFVCHSNTFEMRTINE